MARHTPKVALVPSAFFFFFLAREILSRTVALDLEDKVEYISLPELSAELVYSLSPDMDHSDGDEYPDMYHLLKKIPDITEYNKILASYGDNVLTLVIAQGENLLLANTFEAADFTTAEYFLFMAVKKLQLNPEVSSVHFLTDLSGEEEMSLYRYFKSVERL